MYLLGIFFEKAEKNCSGKFCFRKYGDTTAKWILLPSTRSARELLQIMTLASGGVRSLNCLHYDLKRFCRTFGRRLHLESILAPHAHDDTKRTGLLPLFGSDIETLFENDPQTKVVVLFCERGGGVFKDNGVASCHGLGYCIARLLLVALVWFHIYTHLYTPGLYDAEMRVSSVFYFRNFRVDLSHTGYLPCSQWMKADSL